MLCASLCVLGANYLWVYELLGSYAYPLVFIFCQAPLDTNSLPVGG